MSYFKAKMHQIRFRLGELTALPHTSLLDLRGKRGEEVKGQREGSKGLKGGYVEMAREST